MPKMKTHSGAKKRFRRTASGKYKHKKAGMMHILTPSSAKRGRQMRRPGILNSTDQKTLDKYLPY